MRKPTNADGSCKQGANNICAASEADEGDNGWIEPLLTLGEGDRGRDSRGRLSQSGTGATLYNNCMTRSV